MVTENLGSQEGAAGTSVPMEILSKVPIFQFLSPQELAGVARRVSSCRPTSQAR